MGVRCAGKGKVACDMQVKGRWRVTCGCGASVGRLLGAARGEAFGHVQHRMHLVRAMQWERIAKREATPAIKVEVEVHSRCE
eukprot:scaffold18334_cov46-Phaeocystis_antarctica.AAC.1